MVMQQPGRRGRPSLLVTAIMLLMGAAWFFLPVGILVALKLPPYAFGHEGIGVRFFQAWLPLQEAGLYPRVLVGYLLDLFHRGLLWFLVLLGASPERDFVGAMTLFANTSLFVHAAVMVLVSSRVLLHTKLGLSVKVATLVTGASLGYGFFWAPLRLFVPDYPLTLSVLAYASLAFAVTTVLATANAQDASQVSPEAITRHLPIRVALLAAAMLFLKPSLIVWVILLFFVGVAGHGQRGGRWIATGSSFVALLFLLSAAWLVLLGPNTRDAQRYAAALLYEFSHLGSAEPFFHLRDFLAPGTMYFLPFLGFLIWLVIVAGAIVLPDQQGWRGISIATLFGGISYLYVLLRRPGDAATFEILVYLTVTGSLCAMLYKRSTRVAITGVWCAALFVHAIYVGLVAYPQLVVGASHTAQVATAVDQYARSFRLPILYAFPEYHPVAYDMFQSAESAAFKGVQYCAFGTCTEEMRRELLSRVVSPYEMVGQPAALPSTAYVLLTADVPEAPVMAKKNAPVKEALGRARSCRHWQQFRHAIRVCLIPARE